MTRSKKKTNLLKKGGELSETDDVLEQCDRSIDKLEQEVKNTVPDIDKWTDVKSEMFSKNAKERIKFVWDALGQARGQNNRYRKYIQSGQWRGISGQSDEKPMSNDDVQELTEHISKFCKRQTGDIETVWNAAKQEWETMPKMRKLGNMSKEEKKAKVIKALMAVGIFVAMILVIGYILWNIMDPNTAEKLNMAEKWGMDHTSGVSYTAFPKPYPEPLPVIGAKPTRYTTWGAEYPMGDHRSTMEIVSSNRS